MVYQAHMSHVNLYQQNGYRAIMQKSATLKNTYYLFTVFFAFTVKVYKRANFLCYPKHFNFIVNTYFLRVIQNNILNKT